MHFLGDISSVVDNNGRPDWDTYFFALAKLVSSRSHDSQTRHGCVIVKDKKILGVGYNGFPHSLKDSRLPTTRPEKYSWMIHAEINAITNCVIKPDRATAYITGEPCNNCLMNLWQNGVVSVKYKAEHGSHLIDNEQREIRERFLEMSGMRFIPFL